MSYLPDDFGKTEGLPWVDYRLRHLDKMGDKTRDRACVDA